MATQSQEAAPLILRLDHLPFSGWHRRLFVLAFVGVMFDAADFAMFGAALPPIASEFKLGPAEAELELTHEFATQDQATSHAQGWNQILSRLAAYLEGPHAHRRHDRD